MNFKRNLKNANLLLFLGICLIIIGLFTFSKRRPQSTSEMEQPQNSQNFAEKTITEARVMKVFDGDTIEIEGGAKVRYIGIDAAEVYPAHQCFSDEALIKNKELVSGKIVRLEKDVSETDKYGRLLRYVYVGDVFINDELTKEGYTKVMTVPPDVKYKDLFLQSENYAKENNLGLWTNCR